MSDDEILDATARAVGHHGPARFTLADVASEAGITAAAIVQRFGSKADLLLALSRRGVSSAADAVAEAKARRRSPLAALLDFLGGQVSGIDSPEVLANHVAFLQLDLVEPALRTEAQAHARTVVQGIQALLEAAVDAGELEPTDCGRLATAVQTTYNGALITWALAPRGTLARWVRSQVSFLLEPYRRRPARPNPR